jgi:hypothetical protein
LEEKFENYQPTKKNKGAFISTTGGTILTSTEVEEHRLNRTEKKLKNDLKKLEKQQREKQLQLDGIHKQKEVQQSPSVTITEIPSDSTNLLLLPSSIIPQSQDQSTSTQTFTLPTNTSPPISFIVGDIVAFGYPYLSQTPQWKIGKIIVVDKSTINVLISSSTEKKNVLFYSFIQGESVSIPKSSVVAPVLLNVNGNINLRSKSSSFLTTLGLVKKQ